MKPNKRQQSLTDLESCTLLHLLQEVGVNSHILLRRAPGYHFLSNMCHWLNLGREGKFFLFGFHFEMRTADTGGIYIDIAFYISITFSAYNISFTIDEPQIFAQTVTHLALSQYQSLD